MRSNKTSEILVSAMLPDLQTQTFQHPEGTLAYIGYGGRGELVLISTFAREQKPNPFMKAMSRCMLMLNNPWRTQTWRMFYRTLFLTRTGGFRGLPGPTYREFIAAGAFRGRQSILKSAPPTLGGMPAARQSTSASRDGYARPGFPRPGGWLMLIEAAGHNPQTEMPGRTAPAVLDYHRQA
jgi:hypothetical protein